MALTAPTNVDFELHRILYTLKRVEPLENPVHKITKQLTDTLQSDCNVTVTTVDVTYNIFPDLLDLITWKW